MNNTPDINAFRHFLRFEGIGFDGLYEIAEPIGFDASSFNIDQASKRYGRDVVHGGLDKLTFIDRQGKDNGVEQVINQQGQISTYLDYGLAWLLYGYKKYAFEFKAFYSVSESGVFNKEQCLDFSDKDVTDGYTYVRCKLIDKGEVMNIKRRFDDKFNLFSETDINKNELPAVPTLNVLLKATLIVKNSEWIKTLEIPNTFQITKDYFICFNRNINESEILDTLTSANADVLFDTFGTQRAMTFQEHVNGGGNSQYLNVDDGTSMKLVKAKNLLTKVKANIKLKCTLRAPFLPAGQTVQFFYFLMVANEGSFHTTFYNDENYIKILTVTLTDSLAKDIDLDITLDIPITVPIGKTLYGAYTCDKNRRVDVSNVSVSSLNILAYQNSIDTVIKAVRWIDVIKRSIKYYSYVPVNAQLFDVGGVHYNNVVFNRTCISQKTDKFTINTKDTLASIEEVNCDYEMDENEIFIGHQTDYYKNVEIGAFVVIPSETQPLGCNDRTMISRFTYGYKKYEQNRNTEGTAQSIHTDSEWTILNQNVENSKDVKNTYTRDPIAIQVITDLEVNEPTTSVTEDDDVYISNIVPLAPGTYGGFAAYLHMRIANGKVEILNRDSQGESSDVVINWSVLGFNYGAIFAITQGENIGSYVVENITKSIITLGPLGFTPTFQGDAFFTFSYAYSNVGYVTRTDEGFILNPTKFGNVAYSIKRNITNYFGELLANTLMYCKKDLFNSYFKSNGKFKSQIIGEPSPIIEDDTILYDSLPDPLITGFIYNLTLVAGFNKVLAMQTAYKMNRGFIRCVDLENKRVLKLYPQKTKQIYSTNQFTIVGEEKFETEFIDLVYNNGILRVNDVVYNLNGNLDWFIVEGIGMFTAYDANNMMLCNSTYFDKVKVNGVIYTTKNDLVTALNALV